VQALLRDHLRIDGLLLRHTIAARAASSTAVPATPAVASAMTELQARFDAAARRGDAIHQREQARFELHLRQNPRAALELALANWQVQKEIADLRILLEAAHAARDPAAARAALAWRRQHGLEDGKIAALARQLEGGA
jgi:multidrug resistance efflux pump